MREVLLMWRKKRMIVLVIAITIIYTAVLVPFKQLSLFPGFSSLRPGNVLPVVAGLMFGPAGAWGSMLGNLAGDFLGGTWSVASYPGAVGNFFTAFVAYRLWGNLGPLSTGKVPNLSTSDQFPEYLLVSVAAASVTAAIIGWGTEIAAIIPFPIIALTILFNNTLAEVFLGPPLLYLLYPRFQNRGLLYHQLLDKSSLPSPNPFQNAAAIALVLLSVGWLVAGSAYGMIVENVTIQDIVTFQFVQTTGSSVQIGGGGILFVLICGASVLAGEQISRAADYDGDRDQSPSSSHFGWLTHQTSISIFALSVLGISLASLYEAAFFIRIAGSSISFLMIMLQLVIGLVLPIVILLGGWWILRTDYARDRFWRIVLWTFGGIGLVTIFSAWQFYQLYFGLPSSDRIIETFLLSVQAGAVGGMVVGIYDARADWTSKALAEERANLERQNERLEGFASVVSHDLRNPLNVSKGRIDIAREKRDSEHLEAAAEGIERSFELIDDLLALARGGQDVSDREAIELADFVDECWETVETPAAEIEVDVESTIHADRSRLRQLFENLFRNSVEHGGEDVTITIGPLSDGFYVEDDGSGIAKGEREEVFKEGYSKSQEGTGFGLSIVKQIVEAHGWTIRTVEGSAGGARFEITGVDLGDE